MFFDIMYVLFLSNYIAELYLRTKCLLTLSSFMHDSLKDSIALKAIIFF